FHRVNIVIAEPAPDVHLFSTPAPLISIAVATLTPPKQNIIENKSERSETYCYPTRPLNERSPELTWQAWLLVDDQNQNQNKQQTNSDGVLRRRITPKSVFIAPTFSPESLPPCAEGYSSDQMGRCIKIIKLDQDAHYAFLDEVEEELPMPGPYQVNIPLGIDNNDENDEETDIAIVVSPTKTLFENKGINLDKRDSIDDENTQEMFLKKLAETTTKKNYDTTTVAEQSTTVLNSSEQTTTMTEDLSSITDPITTTDEDFFTSTESRNAKRSTTDLDDISTTSTEDLPTTTVDSTTTPYKEMTTVAPKVQVTQIESSTPNLIRFPDEPKPQTLLDSSFVKFPDSEISFQTQIPSSVEQIPNTRDVNKQFNEFDFPRLADSPASDRKVIFRDQPHAEIANLDYSNGMQRQLTPTTTHRMVNRRNRDKHNMFLLPPRWGQPNFQKPLVLRFSRKHAYLDESQFKNPDYYRSVPSDDFAYLFKFKHKQLSHR
ncbi:hypothetical protein NQ314_002473, partial [Rhamnusium bicolor]